MTPMKPIVTRLNRTCLWKIGIQFKDGESAAPYTTNLLIRTDDPSILIAKARAEEYLTTPYARERYPFATIPNKPEYLGTLDA
jgi:hypothetical protein